MKFEQYEKFICNIKPCFVVFIMFQKKAKISQIAIILNDVSCKI